MQRACGPGHVSERLEKLGRDWLDFGEVDLNELRLKIRRLKEVSGKADPELKVAVNDLSQLFKKAQRPEDLEEAYLEKQLQEIADRLDKLLDEDDKLQVRRRQIFSDLLRAYPEFKKGKTLDSVDWKGLRARALRDFRGKMKPDWARLNDIKMDSDVRGAVRVAIEIVTSQEQYEQVSKQLDGLQGVKGKPSPAPDSLTPAQTPLRS